MCGRISLLIIIVPSVLNPDRAILKASFQDASLGDDKTVIGRINMITKYNF